MNPLVILSCLSIVHWDVVVLTVFTAASVNTVTTELHDFSTSPSLMTDDPKVSWRMESHPCLLVQQINPFVTNLSISIRLTRRTLAPASVCVNLRNLQFMNEANQ